MNNPTPVEKNIMTENASETRNPLKILGFLIPLLPSLILRFGGEFIRFKSRAQKGGRVFQDELVRQGLDETTATRLTALYLEGSDPFKLLRSLR
jgi:hypothetical protein